MITDSRKRLLAECRLLARTLSPTISADLLPAVVDGFSSQQVRSWRQNGISPEHSIHKMMPRVGGFPPALARYFIAAYSGPGDIVFDPYCGKGTVLFEATTGGRTALGGDVAPDAVIATRAKCVPVSFSQVANYVQGLDYQRGRSGEVVSADVRLFFHSDTFKQIVSVRDQLLDDMASPCGPTRNAATFVCGVMLGILHGHSRSSLSLPCNQCFAMAPNYVRRYVREHGLERPRRDVRQCLLDKMMLLLPRPALIGRARVFQGSAEVCTEYLGRWSGAIDLVITSPPYLNRQTYSKDAWLRQWFLGYDHREVAKRSLETGSVQLFVDAMQRSLRAILSVVKPGGRLVLVGGRARIVVGKKAEVVRIVDLCLQALKGVNADSTIASVDAVIEDRRVMSRGSYFAVHAGRAAGDGGGRRFGEEDILIIRKRPE